jgi:proteic killer suppression protein
VIVSFKDSEAEKIFNGARSRKFEAIAKVAYRKLAILHSAAALHDLKSPGLQLEALREDRAGQHSIRINERYRICFVWHEGSLLTLKSWTTIRGEEE